MKSDRTKIFRNSERKAIELVRKIFSAKEIHENKGVFDWLRGDKETKLRVDAYFPVEKLVLEYNGIQHSKPSKLMDRRKGRAEQRKKYTELRQKLIPEHGLKLLEINYDEPLTLEHIKERLREIGYKV